ncbi:SPOR domain-containing protein [Robiginitalea sp. M39]|uniref:SPOR domain-containing protein n=2 Tax=Robiginitalea aurantiaca TaxID=3056915 RepID=A0ABT7WAJ6_9FLAO|nr:SPOR domain-containing protein [Robiginitalea aurantiaca]
MSRLLNFAIFVLMQLENYISSLLYRYQCVVVPGFGAFLCQIKSASLQVESNTFLPPYKELSFNSQLQTSDGLLVSHIAQAEGKSYEETLENVLSAAKDWSETLKTEKQLDFPDLGSFRMNQEGRISFEPTTRVNYLMSSFGLSPVIANGVTREVLKEEVRQIETNIPFTITPEARKVKGLRPLYKYAAVVLLAVSTTLSGYSLYQEKIDSTAIAYEKAQKEVSKSIQEATFFSTRPVELPSINLNVHSKIERSHHIIAGAYRIRENADKRISQLLSRGYDARYLGQNRYGLYQVTYASFADPNQALEFLKKVRSEDSADAWLLSMD